MWRKLSWPLCTRPSREWGLWEKKRAAPNSGGEENSPTLSDSGPGRARLGRGRPSIRSWRGLSGRSSLLTCRPPQIQVVNSLLCKPHKDILSLSNILVFFSSASVAYQKDPTFRVVLPSGEQVGYRHCDADYHHPPAEVNWWIPLTSVHTSNSLFTESTPGKGDFRSVEMEYGQALRQILIFIINLDLLYCLLFRFYGNLCCHYTVPNTTDSTRVSFDLRVLSLEHHDPHWKDRLGRDCLFKVGAYYRKV